MKQVTILEFLADLRRLEIKISADGDRLRCQAPDGVLTPALRQEIAARKSEIIAFLDRVHQKTKATLPAIERVSRDREIPLSFAQQRLWFLHQIEPNSTAYNIPAVLEMTGTLDPTALEKAVQEIVRRHEVLRTVFTSVNGSPVQVISTNCQIAIEKCQVTPREADKLIAAEMQRSFDLATFPLLRVMLLKLEEKHHILLVTMHHIVSDGWSLEIFLRELSLLYQVFCVGEPSPLLELSIQYADYAHWQQHLTKGVFQQQLDYWRSQLADAPQLLELPMTRSRPPVQTFSGASHHFQLGKTLTQQINTLSKKSEVTPFMTLLAAFAVLLSRYSDREDILIGTPIANRNRSEISSLIGFFINTLVLRFRLKDNPTFATFLSQAKQVILEAHANSDLPFEQVVEALHPERSLSYSPLFQVMFVWQNAPMGTLELPGLTLTPQATEITTAKFDLIIYLTETDSELKGWWEYNTDLFDAATIARMTEHFQVLLRAIVAGSEQRISELPLLSAAERDLLLIKWNQPSLEPLERRCIHQEFEAQVEKTPNAIAVVDEKQQLTYQKLNSRANQLAHYLQKLGVAPETLVGICIERSVEMVVGILGILKAGGAYVPIDPSYPDERIAHILQDAQISILVTEKDLLSRLGNFRTIKTVWVEQTQAESCKNLHSGVKLENLAYVIYTSGSTGVPKGVMIPHNAIANHMEWMQKEFPLSKTDRVLQKTPFCFDASVWEFYAPLLVGAQLVMARPQGHTDSKYLIDTLRERDITIVQVVPALLQMLLEAGGLESCRQLKRVFCGGEALSASLQERFRQVSPALLVNLYGPTEATIDVSYFRCEGTITTTTVPIGRPIDNIQMYILDRDRQLTPIGVTGELYLGGAGLARGYVNNLSLTQERFIPNPFSEGCDRASMRRCRDRLYKTGDLARYLPDGNIEYLGRCDNQIKLRGLRIELGEIEKQLLNYGKQEEGVLVQQIPLTRCTRCVMPSTYPGIKFNQEGVCNFCRQYERYQEQAQKYFKTTDELHALIEAAKSKKRSEEYDILLLFSGGKDSSYALYRLVEMGYKVLTFTFDNGYISEGAFRNIQHITSKLNVKNIVLKAAKINDIFRESLKSDYSVCTGCFRSLTALSTKLAYQQGINVVVTGLSRGQIFDTKLQNLFANDVYDVEQIERELLLFRKMYHRRNDAIEKLLNVEVSEQAFDNIYFVDFFRYEDTPASQVQEYLQKADEYWLQPEDTGFCSTNCLANDVGIYVHSQQKGYHNYAVPISWDIRLGSSREEGLKKLSEEVDQERVNKILSEIGYFKPAIKNVVVTPKEDSNGNMQLTTYLIPTDTPPKTVELRQFLQAKLPDYMIPSRYVILESFPLTANGKIDIKALPTPENTRSLDMAFTMPQTETEKLIAKVWQDVLQIEKVGIYDNFFELGGHSLMMTQVASKLSEIFGDKLSILDLFKEPTISALAKYINQKETMQVALEPKPDRTEVRTVGQNLLQEQRQRRMKHRTK